MQQSPICGDLMRYDNILEVYAQFWAEIVNMNMKVPVAE